MKSWLALFFQFGLLGLAIISNVRADAATASLSRTTFEARGKHTAILTVRHFGRFAIIADSAQGTAIQIVDQMAGPGAGSGEAGQSDGRLDLILEKGNYKIITTSHEKGSGPLTLAVRSFKETSLPQVPILQELHPVEGWLEDCQQISFWLQVEYRRIIYLEAEGRDLADLRLWHDGGWLIDADPSSREKDILGGKSVTSLSLVADLNPGYYLVTAYGGPARPWAKETGEHPFRLRLGLPLVKPALRLQADVSPFGEDRYLVPEAADYFHLQLLEKKEFSLTTLSFNIGDIPGGVGAAATISKKSQDPECRIQRHSDKNYTLVTVSGPPGETYILHAFDAGRVHRLSPGRSGEYWLSTIHTGYMEDNIDATGILVANEFSAAHVKPEGADVVHLGPDHVWNRQFNLLETATLYCFVEEDGDYLVRAAGVPASFRFEPFMILGTTPPGYKSPDFQPAGSIFPLTRGYWEFDVAPQQKGIISVEVTAGGGLLQKVARAVMPEEPIVPDHARGSCRISRIFLDTRHSYTLYLNGQPGVDIGMILRPYPLDLSDPLPVTLRPSEEITIPFHVAGDGELAVVKLPVASFSLWVDGVSAQARSRIGPGDHQARLRNENNRSQEFSLQFTPGRLLPGAAPTYLSPRIVEGLDKFPLLTESTPLFFDFDQTENKTVLLQVEEPALYRFETTGLLKTSCTIRTRTQTRLFADQAGGIGRNCLIQQYLRSGEYQVTVQTMDRSAGHCGLRLTHTLVVDGGSLTAGKDDRAAVPAGSAIRYAFDITDDDRYQLRTIGQEKMFYFRLEDDEGWPMETPNSRQTELSRRFEPGRYHYLTLPRDVDTLRITRLEKILPQPRAVAGHGPFLLRLNERVANVWREPAKGDPRVNDLFDFTLPAEAGVTITFDQELMQAFLTRKELPETTIIDTVLPGKPWTGTLPPGDYRLKTACGRENDRQPYTVLVSVNVLMAGTEKTLHVPGSVPVCLAADGVAEIFSIGAADVRGTLIRDEDGEIVAQNDDAFCDWNFRIAARLPAGRYTLRVDPVGSGGTDIRVAMNVLGELRREPVTPPFDLRLDLQGGINILPLRLPPGDGILTVHAEGGSFQGCILERVDRGEVDALIQRTGKTNHFDVPLMGGEYQLRLWSADHQDESARLQVAWVVPGEVGVEDLGPTFTLAPLRILGEPAAFLRLQVKDPGTFRFTPAAGFAISCGAGQPLAEAAPDLVRLPAGTVFVKWAEATGGELHPGAERIFLQPGPAHACRLELTSGRPQWIDTSSHPAAFSVLTAGNPALRPGCVFLPPDAAAGGDPILSRSLSIGERISAAVSPPGGARKALVWNTAPNATGYPPTEVRLASFPMPADLPRPIPDGFSEGETGPGGQTHVVLPPGNKTLTLDLQAGLVAAAWDRGMVSEVISAAEGAARRTIHTSAERLSVFNIGDHPAAFAVTLWRDNTAAPAIRLGPDRPFERVFPAPGQVRLELAPPVTGKDWILHADGPDVAVQVLNETGIIQSGNQLPVRGEGVVFVTHGTGLVAVWVAEANQSSARRWGDMMPADGPVLAPNSVIDLKDPAHWYTFALDHAAMIRLETGCPAVVAVCREEIAGGDPFLLARGGWPSCMLSSYLEPGRYRLGLRGVENQPLAGQARFTVTDICSITGTFGPESLLSGGEARLFAFSLPDAGAVGIGLRTEREVLDCTVFNGTMDRLVQGRSLLLVSNSREAASGLTGRPLLHAGQQFLQLKPGKYLLLVTAAAGETPVRFTPVVVGLTPPDTGPPEDYLHELFQKIGLLEGEDQ